MAPATRSTYRGPLSSLPYKIAKAPAVPKYKCILCDRKFRKGWVKTHFRSHRTIPYNPDTNQSIPAYTHPSCWPATQNYTWERQDALLDVKQRRMMLNLAQDEAEDYMQELGALTRKEFAVKQELKRLSFWRWWWEAQGDDIGDALENAPAGRLNITGLASGEVLPGASTSVVPALADEQERGLDEYPSTMAGDSLRPVAVGEFIGSVSSDTMPNYRDYFPRDRGPGAGRLWTELDLSGHKPLTLRTIEQFISTCNIDYLKANGENFDSSSTIGRAAREFVGQLTLQSSIPALLQRYLQTRQNTTVYNLNDDRKKLWGAVAKSTKEILAGRDEIPRRSQDERDLTDAMEHYAVSLRDRDARRMIQLYRDGSNDALDSSYDSRFGLSRR